MFYWEDNVLDPNVTPLNGASQETFGEGTTLEKIDDVTVKLTFTTPFPRQVIFALAYGTFCPGPAHMLKPQHPKYSKNTYDQYRNAFPPTYMNMPVMGAWVPVEYRSDDIIVMRRNPYYWKVDEEGHQLPYLNELQYRLSTWADRDVQAVAGTGDFSNLEQPESYVEALKRSADPAAPARLALRAALDRLHAVPEPLRPTAGASPTRAARRCASSTATSTSARRSPWRSTGSGSASRWSRGRSPRSTRAGSWT